MHPEGVIRGELPRRLEHTVRKPDGQMPPRCPPKAVVSTPYLENPGRRRRQLQLSDIYIFFQTAILPNSSNPVNLALRASGQSCLEAPQLEESAEPPKAPEPSRASLARKPEPSPGVHRSFIDPSRRPTASIFNQKIGSDIKTFHHAEGRKFLRRHLVFLQRQAVHIGPTSRSLQFSRPFLFMRFATHFRQPQMQ